MSAVTLLLLALFTGVTLTMLRVYMLWTDLEHRVRPLRPACRALETRHGNALRSVRIRARLRFARNCGVSRRGGAQRTYPAFSSSDVRPSVHSSSGEGGVAQTVEVVLELPWTQHAHRLQVTNEQLQRRTLTARCRSTRTRSC